MRKIPEKERLIGIYSERYEALHETGGIVNGDGGYNRMSQEDRFRAYCCQEVWTRTRFAETDRLLQFAKAVWATSDINLSLDDPVMAKAFERYKADPRAHSASRNLSYPENRKNYIDIPCPQCGKLTTDAYHLHCKICRAKIRT